ncbi:hypothetical protein HPB50_013562 [Hyalomma asiaticum]|uniref:Uncharacterized protein n=1 Tax=Hyalomma asiaticum TaxID=266040 RepID=A0ACB7S9S9_HYAAI|nr:hypothetical protein HPB50_013562 [Hyalomma asiaticum]
MGRTCFIPSCRSGYRTRAERVPLFKAPSDRDRLEQWRRAIPRADRTLTPTHNVCAKHFSKDMISTAYHLQFKGKVLLDVPKRPVLYINAIPTLFPDCSKHLTQSSKHKEPPKKSEPPVQAPAPCWEKVYNIDAMQPVQISSATVVSVDPEAALSPQKRRHLETATLTSCLALGVSINPRLSG